MITNKTLDPADYADLAKYTAVFDEIRNQGGRVDHQHRAWEYAIVLDALQENVEPIKTVLDVGSGGSFFAALATRFGYEVTVIDPTFEVHNTHDDTVKKIQADFNLHDFGDQKFDAVVAISVLEHVENDAAFIQKMAALAKYSVCLTVDFSQDGATFSPHHLRTYPPKALFDLSKKLGKKWKLTDMPDWSGDGKHVFDQYNFAGLAFYHV